MSTIRLTTLKFKALELSLRLESPIIYQMKPLSSNSQILNFRSLKLPEGLT